MALSQGSARDHRGTRGRDGCGALWHLASETVLPKFMTEPCWQRSRKERATGGRQLLAGPEPRRKWTQKTITASLWSARTRFRLFAIRKHQSEIEEGALKHGISAIRRPGESWPPGARLYRACVGVARAGRAARGAGIYLPKRSKRSKIRLWVLPPHGASEGEDSVIRRAKHRD